MVDVILVDDDDNQIGLLEKLRAHTRPGALHRAVSVFVFDSNGRLLLQQRSTSKYHFPGLWSNAACTHPFPGESLNEAGRRGLAEEMGIDLDIRPLLRFAYRAEDVATGLVEHELDHVLVGRTDENPSPSSGEVMAWSKIEPAELEEALGGDPSRFTPWLGTSLPMVLERLGLATDQGG